MPLGKHRRDHQKLGVSGWGKNVMTVGRNGHFASIVSALAYAVTLPEIENTVTTACSISGSTASSTLDSRLITADAGTPFDVYSVGDLVAIKIGATPSPVLGLVYSNTTILCKNPILADFTATSCQVGVPNYKSVVVLPGHIETINTTGSTIPAFTTIEALVRGTTKIIAGSTSELFNIPSSTNEVRLRKIGINIPDYGTIRIASYAGHSYQSDTYIEDIDVISASQDGFYFGLGNNLGGVHVRGCNIVGGYDCFRLGAHREVNFLSNRLDAFSIQSTVQAQASTIAFGTTATPTAMPVQTYNFIGNNLKAFGQDLLSGTFDHGSVRALDLRNRLSSDAVVNVLGNSIYASGDDVNDVSGFTASASGAGAETPTIIVKDNVFDSRNEGTGAEISMSSTVVNYDIKRANNVQIGGTVLGTNTTALTTV